MKKKIVLSLMVMATLNVIATSKKPACDTLTITTTPQMHCASCENKIKQNIRFVKGVKSITTSIPNQRVIIVYDSRKATLPEFTAAFKKIGYDIKETLPLHK